MPDIEFAFLADAADARPGQKFAVIGGGVSRLGGPVFPLRHPHLALVVGLAVPAEEIGREQDLRFIVLTPDGSEMASAQATVVAGGPEHGRDSVLTFALDLWNLAFPVPGDYGIRILIDGEERKRLPLVVEQRRPAARRARAGSARANVTPPFPPPTGKA
ncbi:MAG: hypothetical protein H0V04_00835 [Chloroflexi bacterium]|nr:hypothetical protein [Chloroflexota bacterium]